MKRPGLNRSWLNLRRISFVSAFLLFLASAAQATIAVPELTEPVIDQAGIFESQIKEGLSKAITDYKQKTGVQIQVLTLASLDGEPLEDLSLRVANTWKIGDATSDNGILLVFVSKQPDEPGGIRIEIGQGLEGKIPDARAGRIIDTVMLPEFKKGNSQAGIIDGISALTRTLGEPIALRPGYGTPFPQQQNFREVARPPGFLTIMSFLFLLIFLPGFFSLWLPLSLLRRGGGYIGRGWSSSAGSSFRSWSGGGGGFSGGGASGRW